MEKSYEIVSDVSLPTWFDSLKIELKTEPPTNPDGTPIQPQVAFIQDVNPKDRRICMASHDFLCRKTRFEQEELEKELEAELNRDSKRSCANDRIYKPKEESKFMKELPRKNSFPGRFRASVSAGTARAELLTVFQTLSNKAKAPDTNPTETHQTSNEPSLVKETIDNHVDNDNDDESIGEILTSLVTKDQKWSFSISRPGDGFGHSVYQKFIQYYEHCYNQHDSDLLLQVYLNTCFSHDVSREIYYWKAPYTLIDKLGNVIANHPPYLIYRHEFFGVYDICHIVSNVYKKVPDAIVVYTGTKIKYIPERGITMAKTSLTYFLTVPVKITTLSNDNQPTTITKFIKLELQGYSIYIFNSEGRIIKIFDTVVANKCSDSNYAPINVLKILGYS